MFHGERNVWFCLLSFWATARLWRLIQETALISGVDWKDTGSATSSHVTLGKSLTPHWVALFINYDTVVSRRREFWRSSTGRCLLLPTYRPVSLLRVHLVHLEDGTWCTRESLVWEHHWHGVQFFNQILALICEPQMCYFAPRSHKKGLDTSN